MKHTVRRAQAGFTLVELMIALAIASVLSAAVVPIYFGYTKDARMAEGKALAGSAYTALQGCAQVRNGKFPICSLVDIARHIGVDQSTGATGDGRWVLTVVPPAGTPPPTFIGTVGVVGVTGKNTDAIGIGLHARTTGTVLRCLGTGNIVPGRTQGSAC